MSELVLKPGESSQVDPSLDIPQPSWIVKTAKSIKKKLHSKTIGKPFNEGHPFLNGRRTTHVSPRKEGDCVASIELEDGQEIEVRVAVDPKRSPKRFVEKTRAKTKSASRTPGDSQCFDVFA